MAGQDILWTLYNTTRFLTLQTFNCTICSKKVKTKVSVKIVLVNMWHMNVTLYFSSVCLVKKLFLFLTEHGVKLMFSGLLWTNRKLWQSSSLDSCKFCLWSINELWDKWFWEQNKLLFFKLSTSENGNSTSAYFNYNRSNVAVMNKYLLMIATINKYLCNCIDV